MEIKYLADERFGENDLKHIIEKENLIKGITNYKYDSESYEGSGYLIMLGKDGKRRKYDCGHCSCYGPLENGYSGLFSKEEIYKIMDEIPAYDYDYNAYSEEEKKNFLEFIKEN